MKSALTLSILLVASVSAAARAEPCEAPHIQAHLARVEAELLAADVSSLTPAQRAHRAHHVEVLRRYREACVFPHNTLARGRVTPIFVDERGVHCAVGYLMAEDGREDLVERVRATRNTARVQELVDDPDIRAWLRDAGLSAFEAARIQPGYCFFERGDCLCGGYTSGTNGGAEAVAEGAIASLAPATLRVSRVHGSTKVVPGDLIDVETLSGDAVGREALVLLTVGQPAARLGDQKISGDEVSCVSGQSGDTARVAIPTDVYVAALLSEDCGSALRAYDPSFGTSVCTEVPGEGGCRGAGGPAGLGLAVLAVLALLRRRARVG